MPLFRTQSAAMLPSLTPHDSKARLIVVTIRRDSWRSHVHRTRTAQRVQSFKLQTANVRGQGARPLRSLGGLRGIFSHVREYPPYPVQRHRRCHPHCAVRRKKKRGPRFRTAPFLCRFSSRSRYCSHSHCCSRSRSHRRSRRRRRSG